MIYMILLFYSFSIYKKKAENKKLQTQAAILHLSSFTNLASFTHMKSFQVYY